MTQAMVQVVVPRPLRTRFDYVLPPGMPVPAPGCRLRVPFGRSEVTAVCMAVSPAPGAAADPSAATPVPERRLKAIENVIDTEPLLDPTLLSLLCWAADYYHHPLGETVFTALPALLRAGRPVSGLLPAYWAAPAGADPDLLPSRAHRQRACLALLREHPRGLSEPALRDAGFDARVLRALAAHGLAAPVAPPSSGPGPADAACKASVPRPAAGTRNGDGPLTLNPEQQRALDAIRGGLAGFHCFLLDGVTGSGKTEVYLRALELALTGAGESGQALVLIPEIALTPQTVARFAERFGAVATYHSGLTELERARAWNDCRVGRARVLIGTRSAVLVPFADLRLIVVDEEHDGSFKQQEGLRYSARDVAVKRASDLGVPLLLGSATPSLESLRNAADGRYRRLPLPQRTNDAPAPRLQLIDIRGMRLSDGLAPPLIQSVHQHLDAGNQVLLFINRRGFAPSLLCTGCGWRAACEACDAPMTVHRQPPGLRCHHCNRRTRLPQACPHCAQQRLLPLGHGTQRTETAVARLFPEHPVIRIDRDSVRSARQLAAQFAQVHEGRPVILVGTQMLAKGHHFPRVTLAGVLNADAGLFSTDFRAPEHTAQLIIQVAGRAGRAEHPGEVWIQTYNPDNPLLQALVDSGYAGFAQSELQHRAQAGLPPARHMAVLRADGPTLTAAEEWLRRMLAPVRQLRHDGLDLLGPAPAPMQKRADRYRAQCLLIGDNRSILHQALRALVAARSEQRQTRIRWHLDVDPYDLF